MCTGVGVVPVQRLLALDRGRWFLVLLIALGRLRPLLQRRLRAARRGRSRPRRASTPHSDVVAVRVVAAPSTPLRVVMHHPDLRHMLATGVRGGDAQRASLDRYGTVYVICGESRGASPLRVESY